MSLVALPVRSMLNFLSNILLRQRFSERRTALYLAQQTLQSETKARHSRAVGPCEKLYESIARITALK